MLVLSRMTGQCVVVVIGDIVVKVKVAEVRNGKVRLAFDAPPEAVINREEIYERLLEELAGTKPVHVQQKRNPVRPDSAHMPAVTEAIGGKEVSVPEA